MRRLSSLVLRKWKEKERWTGRRRSEPYAGGNEDEEDEGEEMKMESRDRLTDRRMMRRKSEPCGATEEEDQTEEKKKSGVRRERRMSEPSVEEEEVRRDRRRAEPGRGRERRKSTSWLMAEDRAAGQADGMKLRRRSEPCGVLHVQLLPLSGRRRRELLQRRTGRRASCSEEEECHMTKGRSDPAGPLDYSKQSAAQWFIDPPPHEGTSCCSSAPPPVAGTHSLTASGPSHTGSLVPVCEGPRGSQVCVQVQLSGALVSASAHLKQRQQHRSVQSCRRTRKRDGLV